MQNRIPGPHGYSLTVENWDGNYRPYVSRVYRPDGTYVGRTGACKSETRALAAASMIAERDRANGIILARAAQQARPQADEASAR